MRFSTVAAGVLTSAVLAVPLASPALAGTATPSADPRVSAAGTTARHDHHRAQVHSNPALQKALDDLVKAGAPGAMAEVRSAEGTWTGSSGRGDLLRTEPPRPDGLFRAGSVTKTFVATAVLQLVDEGKISLEDSVERHLPGLVPTGEKITVRQLLNHRSGLFDYTESLWPGGLREIYEKRFAQYTPLDLIREANRHKPNFEPGTKGGYSNTNYVLLGLLIEKVTGKPVEKQIDERILKPIKLHQTSFPGKATNIPGPHAHAYLRLDGADSPFVDMTKSNMSWAWAAGALTSSTHDLNTFNKALIGGKLISDDMLKEMKEAEPLGAGAPYGLGITRLDDPDFGTAYGHTGGTPGYTTYAYTLADNSRQVTLSINTMADGEAENRAFQMALKSLLAEDTAKGDAK
ncbi:serine hydrolase domain-containing protein [Streptomyces sp. NPDC086835]|uniref:serine hydrolase domain-containing protein n=1 Tax=Streptomyces sp. NPDC086835 TaxID=3365761 RepID=UPI0037F34BE1